MFRLNLTPAEAALAAALPGCSRLGGTAWSVPPDCLTLLGRPALEEDATAADRGRSRLEAVGLWSRLRAVQQEDVRHALARNGALVGHPTSGGKTLVGLAVATALGVEGPTLIAGPALARRAWFLEHAKWISGAGIDVPLTTLSGRTPRRLTSDEARGMVFVNYEVLDAWAPTLCAVPWRGLVLDEAHEVRGRRTDRTAALRTTVGFYQPLVVALTATAIWSRLDGLWAVLHRIHPGWYGSYWQFAQRYAGAAEDCWGRMTLGRADNAEELAVRLAYVLRRLPKEELLPDLPPCTPRACWVSNPEAALRIAAAAKGLDADAASGGRMDRRVAVALRRETPAKVEALLRVLDGGRGPVGHVFVAAQTKAGARVARDALAAHLGADHVAYIDGEVPLAARIATIQAALERPAPQVVCATMQAVRQSVSCVGFDTVVVLELPPTAEELVQFEGRFHRLGGEVPVDFLIMVIDNSLDARYLRLCLDKLEDRGRVAGLDRRDERLRDVLVAGAVGPALCRDV